MRLAHQTNLDITGIPCYAAVRPNSRTLSVHQGKGTSDTAAKLSAIMEAVEFAIAERPQAPHLDASLDEMAKAGRTVYWPQRQLPRDFRCSSDRPIRWLEGYHVFSHEAVFVPIDSVAIAPCDPEKLPFSQSSNGLAAGFGMAEALNHAICELLERDASTLWALRSLAHCARTAITLDAIDDVEIGDTLSKLRGAGLNVLAFDLTTDLGLPTVMAFLWAEKPSRYFDIASGVCAHPTSTRALLGALEEAAQTRVSNIAGARDDIEPGDYAKSLPAWLSELIDQAMPRRSLPADLPSDGFDRLPERLGDSIIAVPLSASDSDIAVVKVLSETLEDRSTNVHWRPGPRAIRAMTAL